MKKNSTKNGAKRNKNRSNGSRSTSKNMRRDEEVMHTAKREFAADSRDRRDCYRSKDNDPAWYAQNPQLIRDYASYPFGIALGTPLNLGGQYQAKDAIIGLAAYYFAPTVGTPQDANAPVNIAMRNIYSYVRHANSGHSNYDAPDLMLYLLAMDSVYMYHSFLKRIAGLVLDYTTLNRYYPAALVRAMGVDFDDVSSHIQDFRGFINQYAVKMGSMCVPNSMSYMARHTWMVEGIYVDSNTSKAQTYFYTPSAFLQFERDSSSQAGELAYASFCHPELQNITSNALKSYSDLVQFGNSLLNPILQEEDFNIMSGDILKAFGTEGVVKVSGIAEGYMILPQYSPEVLSQMENATVFNGYFNNRIVQDTSVDGGYLKVTDTNFTQVISRNVSVTSMGTAYANQIFDAYMRKHVLNFHHSDVTPEEVMVATRLTNMIPTFTSAPELVPVSSGTQVRITIPTLGSEAITAATAYFFRYNQNGVHMIEVPMSRVNTNIVDNGAGATSLVAATNSLAVDISRLNSLDWHPAVTPVAIVKKPDGVVEFVTGYVANAIDYDNYTTLDMDNLSNMTTAALLSQFSVPQMGAFATKI